MPEIEVVCWRMHGVRKPRRRRPNQPFYLLLDAGVWVLVKNQISRLRPAGKRT